MNSSGERARFEAKRIPTNEANMKKITIAQISDIHCGSSYFDHSLMDACVDQINALAPDLLVLSGDLTAEGFLHEFEMAKEQIARFKTKRKLIVPGNHDSRNVGYRIFEKLFGSPFQMAKFNNDAIVCGADSTEPDLDEGQIGRHWTGTLKKRFSDNFRHKILVLHHHVISIPNCGREMNILQDAGDVLKMAHKAGVDLILSGHKHIPWVWRLENMKVVTCCTTTTKRVRGFHKPSYNIIELDDKGARVKRKEVFGKTIDVC